MLNGRGTGGGGCTDVNGACLVWGDWVMGLLAGGMNTGGASSKSKLGQQQVQIGERLHRRHRPTQFHDRAFGDAQHPGGHHDDHARREFYVNYLTVGASLAVLTPYATPVQWVPAVKDLDFLRDMRRMTQ